MALMLLAVTSPTVFFQDLVSPVRLHLLLFIAVQSALVKMPKQKSDREVEIEQQIAHLQWLKNQNERSYKKSLQKTRVTQQNDQILKIAVDKNNEKFVRMKNVIKDELSKPLVLTDAESYELEKLQLSRHEYFEKVHGTQYKQNTSRHVCVLLLVLFNQLLMHFSFLTDCCHTRKSNYQIFESAHDKNRK